MIKENMKLIIITSLITVLPAIVMKSGMPLILLGVHLICILATVLDKSNKTQNRKVFRMVFWITPIISVYILGMNYLVVSGKYAGVEVISTCLFGVLITIIGNYFPKCKQNAVIGIKLPWTYYSEENWNKTHRLGGKVWVVCGLLMMCTVFFPGYSGGIVLVGLFLVMIIVPTLYSYLHYKKELREGKKFQPIKKDKKAFKISGIIAVVIVVLVSVMMFVGNIEYVFKADELYIEADFIQDMTIDYDEIDSIEYLRNDKKGLRVNGYGSARLVMGTFKNDELGYHTRYSYTNCDTGIKMDLGGNIVIISDVDEESTQKLYEELLNKVK